MNEHLDRERRWIAYFLGDGPPGERAQVEAELEASPAVSAEYRELIEQVRAWANAPVPYEPLRVGDLRLEEEAPPRAPRPRFGWKAAAWTLAAAAVLLLALTQVQFTVSFGDATLAWGQRTVDAPDADQGDLLLAVADRVRGLERVAALNRGAVEALMLRNLETEETFRRTAAQLAHTQQLETITRFSDVQNLLRLTAQPGLQPVSWEPGVR